jgi:hypothetical protein
MKFLCVPCDSPMTLQSVAPSQGGSLSVVYSCPQCGYEMAMLTNPFETQLVRSLGVRIGPEAGVGASTDVRVERASAEAAGVGATTGMPVSHAPTTYSGRCPFPGLVPATEGTPEPTAIRWTAGAEARLANIPEFVRPMARIGIEQFARERGAVEVDENMLDAARDFFGM